MQNGKLRRSYILTVTLAGLAGSVSAQTFDNDAVIALHNAGLGGDAISAKVRSLPCHYDLSTGGLIGLKKAGIPDDVIVAMVSRCTGATRAQGATVSSSDPTAPHPPGIYVDRGGAQGHDLVLLRPTYATGVRVTGNGSILLPYRATLSVAQSSSQMRVTDPQPTFWFYFDPADRKVSSFGTVDTAAAQSPDEFSLVRFKAVANGREFLVGKAKGMGGSVGIDPRNTIRIDVDDAGDGVFKTKPSSALQPGEYAFLLHGRENHYRIFDFTVVSR